MSARDGLVSSTTDESASVAMMSDGSAGGGSDIGGGIDCGIGSGIGGIGCGIGCGTGAEVGITAASSCEARGCESIPGCGSEAGGATATGMADQPGEIALDNPRPP